MTQNPARAVAVRKAVQQDAAADDAALMADARRRAALRLVQFDEASASMSTAQDDSTEQPVFEVSSSALGGDVDTAGSRLLLLANRVELRDPKGRVRARLPLEGIHHVEVRRRLSSAVLVLTDPEGVSLTLKGVRPASAARFRDAVATAKLPTTETSASSPTATALRRLDELAAMGLLTEKELQAKRSQLARHGVQRKG